MTFLASVEIDQRQALITSTDKLKEMLGGSWTIEDTMKEAASILECALDVTPVKTVSGELWLRSGDISQLEAVLWALRERFVRKMHLPCSFAVVEESEGEDVRAAQEKLAAEVRRVKSGKVGEVGFPALPWFAPCLIQPDLFANEWDTTIAEHEQHRRRALLNRASRVRFDRGFETLKNYLHRFPECGSVELPKDLDTFRYGDENSFIGVIRLDADRNSNLFTKRHWESWEELTACSQAIEQSLKSALDFAVRETLKTAKTEAKAFPISPMIAAGEDFLLVARRDLAIPLTFHLVMKYKELANADERLTTVRGEHQLSLSGGVLFARLSYPFSVLDEVVTDLERSAKTQRAALPESKQEGCIDLYCLDSSARENPIEQRNRSSRYSHGPGIYQLFSSPWTVTQLEAVWKAANTLLSAGIPRGKWHDIERLLRLGMPLSRFAWKMWQSGLKGEQRERLREAMGELRSVDLWPREEKDEPWVRKVPPDGGGGSYATVLEELHRIMEMIRIPCGEE